MRLDIRDDLERPDDGTGGVIESGWSAPTLTVIIVTWNCEQFIGTCLDSLARALEGVRAEVVVVDNASSDGTAELMRTRYPWVKLRLSDTNLGFARGNNVALKNARGEHFLLLNPDTVVSERAIRDCLRTLEVNQAVGMVGCRVVDPDGTVQLDCAQDLPALCDVPIETLYLHMLFPRNRVFGRQRMSFWDHQSDRQVPRIGGAFMMIRRRVVEEVGGLDETFFMYYEDLEFCARVRSAGWHIQYLGGPSIVHLGGRSRAQSIIGFDYQTPLSRYLYFKKYRGVGAALTYRVLCAGQSGVWFVGALVFTLFRRLLPRRRPRLALEPAVHWRRFCWCLGISDLHEIVRPSPEAANRRQ